MGHIVAAVPEDRQAILALYKTQLGRPFCPWTEQYPTEENITDDLERDALFVMKNDSGEIIAAISVDDDPAVDTLPQWHAECKPGGELARLAVMPEMQNQGIAKQMILFMKDVLSKRGYKGVHFLVNSQNTKALRSYAPLGFQIVGECDMYDQHFLMYETGL